MDGRAMEIDQERFGPQLSPYWSMEPFKLLSKTSESTAKREWPGSECARMFD